MFFLFLFYSGLPALLTVLYLMEGVPELPKFFSGFEISVFKSLNDIQSSLPCRPFLTDNIDMVDDEFRLFRLFIVKVPTYS